MSASLPSNECIAQAVAELEPWALSTLGGWIRCASTLGHEQEAQDYLAGVLDQLGFAVRREVVDEAKIRDLPGFSPVDWSYEGRPNVVGIHDPGRSRGRSLLLNGHVDVVSPEPVSLWSTPPFEPHVITDHGQRWLQGRGAGDMKGGTVAYLWALSALRALDRVPASKLIVQSPIEEECTGNGTLALCAGGFLADGCLIPEPFAETILIRQLGVLWFQVRVIGRTTHVLGSRRGINAIEKSWLIIAALRQLEAELNRPERIPESYSGLEHPLNLNVGTIRGGDWASTVAGECVTRFRLALFPHQTCDELKKIIETRVAETAQCDTWLRAHPPRVEYIGFQAAGCDFDLQSPLAQSLQKAHALWRGAPPEHLAATCTTDVRFFNLYHGIPATCYGPEALNIHGIDERVSIASMRRVAEVMVSFIGQWCGLEQPRR